MNRAKYVLGFIFTPNEAWVLSVKKAKPEFQKDKYNGIGGHVEDGEDFYEAMVREGKEETGLTPIWEPFAKLESPRFEMGCFRAFDLLIDVPDTNDVGEPLYLLRVDSLAQEPILHNLSWLVPMALISNRHVWPYHISQG